MDFESFIEFLSYTVPSAITGTIAYLIFNNFMKNENNRRRFLLHRSIKKEALPLRLQAYERMVLFLERINLSKIVIRVAPISQDKKDYANLIIQHIDQEFEHNISQQIYISEETWNVILTAKNTTIQMIRKTSMSPEVTDANKLREMILNELLDKQSPSQMAIDILKKEVMELW